MNDTNRTTNDTQAERAGRGGLAVLAAKVFFIATGLVQQAMLPRLTSQADYGALSRVLAYSNIFNNVVVSSSTQGVSRTVAAAGQNERMALRATLRVHAVVAALFALVLMGSAPLVAQVQHAPDILAPLVVIGVVLAVYGVYAPLVGYINGRGLFTRQATLDVVAATLRTVGLLGVGHLFMRHFQDIARVVGTSPGVLGATVGASLAAMGVFFLALRWTGIGSSWPTNAPRPAGVPDVRSYVALIVPVMIAQLFTNGLMQADIFLLGRYLSLGAMGAGVDDPAKAANEWVGAYRAAQLFAFLPYQMLFSVTQVLFPMLARARAEESPERVAELVRRGCRIGVIVCGMLVAVVLAMPESLLNFAYGAAIAKQAAPTLHVLALGQAAFAMFGLGTTVLVSLGRERLAMGITAGALALLVTACVVVIPGASFGPSQLVHAAMATSGALFVALVIGAFTTRRVAGAFIPRASAVRVGVCIVLAFAAGNVIPPVSRLLAPIVAALVVGIYLVALVVMRELTGQDLALVRTILRGRAK